MISFDLSKATAPRFFLYLLALFPGLFFLLSVAVGNPQLAKTVIDRIERIYAIPPYGLLLVLVAFGFVIGQAFVILSWIITMTLKGLYRVGDAAFRKMFGRHRLYEWIAKHQKTPSTQTGVAVRTLMKLHFLAKMENPDPQEARAVRWCLAAATEKLLERRYGIDQQRATGPNGGEWQVWYSVLGKPIKSLVEALNVGRITLACGVAGFFSIRIAPQLAERYYIALCSVFVFSGLWSAGYYFFLMRNPVSLDSFRLRAVLVELQEWSPSESKTKITDSK